MIEFSLAIISLISQKFGRTAVNEALNFIISYVMNFSLVYKSICGSITINKTSDSGTKAKACHPIEPTVA